MKSFESFVGRKHIHNVCRIFVGQRSQQQLMNQAENGSVCPNSQRQCRHDHRRKSRTLHQCARAESHIQPYSVQPFPSPCLARCLFHQLHAAKFPPRHCASAVHIFSAVHALPRRHLQMTAHFFLKLFFFFPALPPTVHASPRSASSRFPYFLFSSRHSPLATSLSLISQRPQRIDLHRPSRRHIARQHCHTRQNNSHAHKRDGIARADAIKNAPHQLRQTQRCQKTNSHTSQSQLQSFT